MTNAEKAMAFQHSKTALASANLDQLAHILTLAHRLNLMLTVKLSLADSERKLFCNWTNFANLIILLWHDARGAPIADTSMAGDTSILKPVQDGVLPIAALPGSSLFRSNLS